MLNAFICLSSKLINAYLKLQCPWLAGKRLQGDAKPLKILLKIMRVKPSYG